MQDSQLKFNLLENGCTVSSSADVSERHPMEQELHSPESSTQDMNIEPEKEDGTSLETPFNPALIRIEVEPMTVDSLIKRLKNREIDLEPPFQRNSDIWSDEAQSRLIESLMIRIPLPAFYFDATDDDCWVVVDGLQRLTAIRRYIIEGNLTLSGLDYLTTLHGTSFSKLPRNYVRRIEETHLIVYLIRKGTPSAVKYNIFKRINTGGLPLSPHEIRNAVHHGEGTVMLRHLAESREFTELVGKNGRNNRMTGEEFILRFLAFSITPPEKFRSREVDEFLTEQLGIINNMSNEERNSLKAKFFRSIRASFRILGTSAFRKPNLDGGGRKPVNKALFESWMVNLDRLSDDQLDRLAERSAMLQSGFESLMSNPDFERAISLATRDTKKLRLRFTEIEQLIRRILDA